MGKGDDFELHDSETLKNMHTGLLSLCQDNQQQYMRQHARTARLRWSIMRQLARRLAAYRPWNLKLSRHGFEIDRPLQLYQVSPERHKAISRPSAGDTRISRYREDSH